MLKQGWAEDSHMGSWLSKLPLQITAVPVLAFFGSSKVSLSHGGTSFYPRNHCTEIPPQTGKYVLVPFLEEVEVEAS